MHIFLVEYQLRPRDMRGMKRKENRWIRVRSVQSERASARLVSVSSIIYCLKLSVFERGNLMTAS